MWNCTFGGLLWLILPFLIGLVTGWWVWAQKPRSENAINAVADLEGQPASPQALVAPHPQMAPRPSEDVAIITPAPAADTRQLTSIGIPAAVGAPDDLMQIKGIGPKLNAVLNDIGVMRFDQIAAWSEAEIARVDEHLGAFRGRIARDAWVAQAHLLARGMIGEFEARFGKLDTENK